MAPSRAGDAADPSPKRVLAAGDWHGNRDWALSVVKRVPQLLRDEQTRVVLHLGDFGIWPGIEGRRYLDAVSAVLDLVNAQLWFVDGNHEDFPQLARMASDILRDGRVEVRPNIFHLPRGYRWDWHGLTWLACGGGVSLDKAARTEGANWWREEEITGKQEAAIAAGTPSRGRRPGGRPRTLRGATRIGNGFSASSMPSSRPI